MIKKTPTLSLILCSRNDSYMGNSRWRLEMSINLTLINAKDANFLEKLEIIVADWGSKKPLSQVLSLIPEAEKNVKFIHIPNELAQHEQKDSKFPEVIALNTAARNACGDFIGRIDNDTIVGTDFFTKFHEINQKKPQVLKNSFLFVERRSVPYRLTKKSLPLKIIQLYLLLHENRLTIESACDWGKPFWQSPVGIMIFQKEIWHEMNGYDENLLYWGWMECDLAIRFKQKYEIVDFRIYVGNNLYHLEHYDNLTAYKDRNGTATPRKKNPVVEEGLKFKANDQNWGLHKYKLKLSDYKLGKFPNPLDLNILQIIQIPYIFFACWVQLLFDSLRISALDSIKLSITSARIKFGKAKEILFN